MNIQEKRIVLFDQWERARNEENWSLSEMSMRDLLDTLAPDSEVYRYLVDIYNGALWARDRTTIELNNAYVKERRITMKVQINQEQEENLRRFWINLKSEFYKIFLKTGLLPIEK